MSDARTHYEDLLARGATHSMMHAAIHAMTDTDLASYGLNAYRMNLISLFGTLWSPQRVEATARSAVLSKLWLGWEYYQHYLPGQGVLPPPPHLRGGLVERVQSLLALGRGLLVASFHQGHMRHIASDLANAGLHMHLPLATDAWRDYHATQAATPGAAMWQYFHYINVEVPGGALAIARALGRKGLVYSTLDGNTGMDGPRGTERRTQVIMHGRNVMVKDGLLTMAAKFGTPILPVIAHSEGDSRVCRFGTVLDPGGRLSGREAAVFVADAAQSLYGLLADDLSEYAGEWCGGDLFHQWRVPEPHGEMDAGAAEIIVRQVLEGHARVAVNPRRATALGTSGDVMLLDALSMRGYKVPADAAEFFDEDMSQAVRGDGIPQEVAARGAAWLRAMVGRDLLVLSARR
ncbi:hypothetical protein D3C71_473580 [compost metagenome]